MLKKMMLTLPASMMLDAGSNDVDISSMMLDHFGYNY
jgi:hypothetical protein